MSKVVFILGGIKSGKSDFAEKLLADYETVSYIATAKATDKEMQQKIDAHRNKRPKNWQTIELGNQTIDKCLKNCTGVSVIIDCLGNLVTQHMEGGRKENFLEEIPEIIEQHKNRFEKIILVSNEAGLSLVPPYDSGRKFCNYIGALNQKIASVADEAYFIVAGLPQKIK